MSSTPTTAATPNNELNTAIRALILSNDDESVLEEPEREVVEVWVASESADDVPEVTLEPSAPLHVILTYFPEAGVDLHCPQLNSRE